MRFEMSLATIKLSSSGGCYPGRIGSVLLVKNLLKWFLYGNGSLTDTADTLISHPYPIRIDFYFSRLHHKLYFVLKFLLSFRCLKAVGRSSSVAVIFFLGGLSQFSRPLLYSSCLERSDPKAKHSSSDRDPPTVMANNYRKILRLGVL